MLKFLTSILFILFSFCVFSQPIASFEKKQIDFGTVTEGTICKYTFKFRNTGNKPLIIYKVDVTCGCTTPRWSSPIKPGDTSSVYVELNTSFKTGYLAKGVNLTVNADDPEVNLVLIANVVPDTNFKTKIDSVTYFPIKTICYKSLCQIEISLNNLHKKKFKGDVEKAENLVKYILRKQNYQVLSNIWYSSNSDFVQINTTNEDYNLILAKTLYKELKSKCRIKRLQKKMKRTKWAN